MRSTTTRKATPRKIKASFKGKTKEKTKTNAAKPSWVKRANTIRRRSMREENRAFTVFAGAILKASSLSMNQKVELLELVSKAIYEDHVRRLIERDLNKANQAYCKEPNKKNSALVDVARRDLAGLDYPDRETIQRYLGRPPTDDEIDQIWERGVPLSSVVANIIAMQRLSSPSAQPAIEPPDPARPGIGGPVMRGNDYVKRIERFLDHHDIANYHFVRRSKHRAVVVEHGGREITVIFPFSGSDWRGPRNVVSSLRRALGLVGGAP